MSQSLQWSCHFVVAGFAGKPPHIWIVYQYPWSFCNKPAMQTSSIASRPLIWSPTTSPSLHPFLFIDRPTLHSAHPVSQTMSALTGLHCVQPFTICLSSKQFRAQLMLTLHCRSGEASFGTTARPFSNNHDTSKNKFWINSYLHKLSRCKLRLFRAATRQQTQVACDAYKSFCNFCNAESPRAKKQYTKRQQNILQREIDGSRTWWTNAKRLSRISPPPQRLEDCGCYLSFQEWGQNRWVQL